MRKVSKLRALGVTAALAFAAAIVFFEPASADARGRGRGGGFGGHGRTIIALPGFYSPYSYYGPGYAYHDHRYGYGARDYRGVGDGGMDRTVARLNGWGAIDVNVKPKRAEVYLDGQYIGTAGEFDGTPAFLWLDEGVHQVTIYKGGFESYEQEINIMPGLVINLKRKLQPGSSDPPSSSR